MNASTFVSAAISINRNVAVIRRDADPFYTEWVFSPPNNALSTFLIVIIYSASKPRKNKGPPSTDTTRIRDRRAFQFYPPHRVIRVASHRKQDLPAPLAPLLGTFPFAQAALKTRAN
ncbi:hypothetical protein LTR28_002158 [Elasticomyces elasticus]|nr:hypothetical protein LTR28_002158 [Elasticomyces elasticus]